MGVIMLIAFTLLYMATAMSCLTILKDVFVKFKIQGLKVKKIPKKAY